MHWRVKWDVLWVKGDVLYSHARRKETMNDLLYICNCQQVDPFQNCFEGRKKSCKISRSLAYTFWEYSIRLLHPEDVGSKLFGIQRGAMFQKIWILERIVTV